MHYEPRLQTYIRPTFVTHLDELKLQIIIEHRNTTARSEIIKFDMLNLMVTIQLITEDALFIINASSKNCATINNNP